VGGTDQFWWGEAPERPRRGREELTAVKSPDLVRPLDSPSRESEFCSKAWFCHSNWWPKSIRAVLLSTAASNTTARRGFRLSETSGSGTPAAALTVQDYRGASPHQPPLLPLKRPMDQPSFQQPKNEADDRVDEELIEIYKKSRG
jgi:hypothetical protein